MDFIQFHPPGTTGVFENCLLSPPAGRLSKQNQGKIERSIQAVFKVVFAPALLWERGARCFVVRSCVLERLDETAAFFGGSMFRDSKAFRRAVRAKIFTPYV